MPRKERDYAAEYARRKALHKGDTFKARGHGSAAKERVERQVRKMYRTAKPGEEVDPKSVYDVAKEKGWDVVENALGLRKRAEDAYMSGDFERAHRLWAERNPDLPDWMFNYHGYFA
jgi:hypothetical protein